MVASVIGPPPVRMQRSRGKRRDGTEGSLARAATMEGARKRWLTPASIMSSTSPTAKLRISRLVPPASQTGMNM